MSSRAAATAMIVQRLLRASSRAQMRCNRRCALQAIATASAGWPDLSVGQGLADFRRFAVVPGGFDEAAGGRAPIRCS